MTIARGRPGTDTPPVARAIARSAWTDRWAVLQVEMLGKNIPGGYGACLGDQWRLDVHVLARR